MTFLSGQNSGNNSIIQFILQLSDLFQLFFGPTLSQSPTEARETNKKYQHSAKNRSHIVEKDREVKHPYLSHQKLELSAADYFNISRHTRGAIITVFVETD